MTFLWPPALYACILLAATLPLVYVWLLRRRKRALKVANLELIREAVGRRSSYRRHLPPLLFYLSLLVMIFALARPAAIVTLPSQSASIVLAIDVSGSMRAQDVEPNRMAAAQAAARAFVADQPRNVRVGLVAFSSNGMIVQVPTVNRADLVAAIGTLYPQRFTAVGSGIMASLHALFPELEMQYALDPLAAGDPRGIPLGAPADAPKPGAPPPVPPGSYAAGVIILLTDGQTNAGIRPLDAAQAAADRGVRVFTVGFGSAEGGIVDFGRGSMRVQLDEETLIAIAKITRGRYFNAKNGADLREIYNSLTAQFITETKRTELTGLLAAPALLLLLLAGALSLLWSNRMA